MDPLDKQMARWAPRLRDDLAVSLESSKALATTIARETSALPEEVRRSLAGVPIALRSRLDELTAFQAFMDSTSGAPAPPVVRAQVVVQSYLCFVYLGEACFKSLRTKFPSGSAGRACCQFLTDNPIRAFRNAVAHGNWAYKSDFSGLVFWARKGDGRDEPLVRFEVSQHELDFWQSVAGATAYAIYTSLEPSPEE